MGLSSVFHPLWTILTHHRKVFHLCYAVSFLVSYILISAMGFDVNSPEQEEYLIKSHKMIEALPRALNQPTPEPIPTAIMVEGNKLNMDPCSDPKSYEAIRILHRQLDDDANGDIDVSESDEFLRDELQYENGYERHREFHGNDKFISVDELWQVWKVSRVHNWTVDETVQWFLDAVDLPEYESNLRNSNIDGTCLPRMAINSNSLLSWKMGIKDPIHRQKIALKAMDIVLFGAPKPHNYLKDVILAVSLIVAICGCWFAYVQHKYSQNHMQKMMKDMEVLQKAEEALLGMQRELNKAKQQQETVNMEKLDLERRLQLEMKTSSSKSQTKLFSGSNQHRLKQLEEQLKNAQNSLHDAEMRLDARSWVAPPTLQHWLQFTYELELKNYNKKKAFAEQQLLAAKDGCERLRKKRTSLLGAFRIAHEGSLDDVDDRIIQARTALSEVTTDLQERMHRWKQIEKMCGVPIIQNLGISYLEALLKPPTMNGSFNSGAPALTRSNSEGTLVREESPPPYAILPNIPPPPKYSKTSPTYSRKVASVVPQKNLNHSSPPVALPKSSFDSTVDENEDPVFDIIVDEFTERSVTPVSCSSQSESIAERSQDIVDSPLEASPDIETSTVDEAYRKISSCSLDDKKKTKKKSMSSIMASFKNSFNSPSLPENESLSSEVSEENKPKKKSMFTHLRRKKAKVM